MSVKSKTQRQTGGSASRESEMLESDNDDSVSSPARELASRRTILKMGAIQSQIEPVPGYRPRRRLPFISESAPAISGADQNISEPIALDAWYAKSGRMIIGALLSTTRALLQKASTTTEIWEMVIGSDDRKMIYPGGFPWRSICSLLITAADGSRWIGTGWLAGPGTVITAGHCVYIHERGGWVDSIEVIPGRNGNDRMYGSCFSSSFRSVRGWTEKQMQENDYGAIILPGDSMFGSHERNGSFGYEVLSGEDMRGLTINISGYPADKLPPGTQWFHSRKISGVTPRTLLYDIDTAPGQSGAPVWRMNADKRYVVGIHTNGDLAGNSATRIVDSVYDNIARWVDEAGK